MKPSRLRYLLLGKPKDLSDVSVFHHLSLVPFLAWVGLGADGLSSSAYGPEEAFKAFGTHRYLSLLLVALMIVTVFLISASYKKIIEDFPHGGGGYVVTSKLLGKYPGVVSGCALLVDYILTITVSLAAAGDALFSFLPLTLHHWKLPFEISMIFLLTAVNMRGVKESVVILTPVFLIFLISHFALISWGLIAHIPDAPATLVTLHHEFNSDLQTFGWFYLISTFLHAYSLGGGTYTGIEAVSNGVGLMREPRVQTAKRTMAYMAYSLAFTASGLVLCYLLWGISPEEGKTLNAVLFEKILGTSSWGQGLLILCLLAEGLLLVVAAQAGFMDGPRVLANMAVDSWVPRSFASLSERLTTSNGVSLMGASALCALLLSHGSVAQLVIMYSINVFLTFSLSIFGMLRYYLTHKQTRQQAHWWSSVVVFTLSFGLCVTILTVTMIEKFTDGGWLTLVATGALVVLCILIKRHYLDVAQRLARLYTLLEKLPARHRDALEKPLQNQAKTAVILVSGYGGLGIYTIQSILRVFPGVFQNFIFVSVGVVDSGKFKGEQELVQLKHDTENAMSRYLHVADTLGVASGFRVCVGTDIVEEASQLCEEIAKEFPVSTFFTGKIIFSEETWFHRLLHNETASALQKRLQWMGHTMVIMPAKV